VRGLPAYIDWTSTGRHRQNGDLLLGLTKTECKLRDCRCWPRSSRCFVTRTGASSSAGRIVSTKVSVEKHLSVPSASDIHLEETSATAILTDARALSALGFHIARLKPGTKQPAGRVGWQDRVATNQAQISWKGDYNIGVMGGSPLPDGNRLLIVDVDVKNESAGDKSLHSLGKIYGPLPTTATVITPSGGKHFYFGVAPDTSLVGVREILRRIGFAGIDLIGAGLFAVAPPSRLAHGQYLWQIPPTQIIAAAPLWLVHLLKIGGMPTKASSLVSVALETPKKPKSRQGHLERLPCKRKYLDEPLLRQTQVRDAGGRLLTEVVDRFPVTGPGQRNNQMHRAVASLFAKGLDAYTVETVMTLRPQLAPVTRLELPASIFAVTH
jgi:hypothetical protein